MLPAEPAELFCFCPSLVTFWGTLVTNDAEIVHFTFYIYFLGALGHDVFEGHDRAIPRHAPVQSGSRAGPKFE